jgi:hypothetical protein
VCACVCVCVCVCVRACVPCGKANEKKVQREGGWEGSEVHE